MVKRLDIKDLKARFNYDPVTGNFRYKPLSIEFFTSREDHRLWNERFANNLAGSEKLGYVYLYVNRRNILAHRVAWALMTGKQPPLQIDHRDRDGTNNRWLNLRDGTSINRRNRGKQCNNTSGITGVSWHKKAGKWQAYVREDGYQHYLGLYANAADAEQAVIAKRKEIGFDVTHGL